MEMFLRIFMEMLKVEMQFCNGVWSELPGVTK